ncbi:hypothetical protein DYB32_005686 [Aphanomyces invadans]|uniref:Autophagy-related protein 16 domain-containing protein n=1 Tax=Aphanomyces invadans TaxID=157072 RepID=A0A418ATW4_9STRA|nr:hypothetical protein DYB32_005686 [Aphanomyces invadans]
MESTRPAQNHPPQQSPLIRATSITSLVKPSVAVAKSNKESRAQEALAMKDEQMRILSDQNTQLLATLNHLDDELQALKMEKVQCDDENRSLRDANFELQSRSRASEAVVKKAEVP